MRLCCISKSGWKSPSSLRACLIGLVFLVITFTTSLYYFTSYKWLPVQALVQINHNAVIVEQFSLEKDKSLNITALEREVSPPGVTGLKGVSPSNVSQWTGAPRAENFRYILNEADKCRDRRPLVVLMIPTAPAEMPARHAVRKTWGNTSLAPGITIVRIFLLGVTSKPDSRLQQDIEEESNEYHDIIQQDYVDTYNNLTIKTVMGMYWVSTYCPQSPYVMKADGDMFVNTEHLVRKVLNPELPPRKGYFTGVVMKGAGPIRDKRSKWHMPKELYPGDRYPPFCSGTAYLFSGDLAAQIYTISSRIKFVHLEDVYVGICLEALGVEPVAPPNDAQFHNWRVPFSPCQYRRLVTSHTFNPNELVQCWTVFQQNKHIAC